LCLVFVVLCVLGTLCALCVKTTWLQLRISCMTPIHRMTVRVRYPEVNGGGRVHHSVYLVYFEMGRTELLRERGIAYADMEADGRFLAIIGCGIIAVA